MSEVYNFAFWNEIIKDSFHDSGNILLCHNALIISNEMRKVSTTSWRKISQWIWCGLMGSIDIKLLPFWPHGLDFFGITFISGDFGCHIANIFSDKNWLMIIVLTVTLSLFQQFTSEKCVRIGFAALRFALACLGFLPLIFGCLTKLFTPRAGLSFGKDSFYYIK